MLFSDASSDKKLYIPFAGIDRIVNMVPDSNKLLYYNELMSKLTPCKINQMSLEKSYNSNYKNSHIYKYFENSIKDYINKRNSFYALCSHLPTANTKKVLDKQKSIYSFLSKPEVEVLITKSLQNIDYYIYCGYTEEEAEVLYYFIINAAPPNGMYYMTEEEIEEYKITTF